MTRALQFATNMVFFAAENGRFRYWYRPTFLGNGVMKLQISRAQLNAFLATDAGKTAKRYVDMFEVGGGWYEVRALSFDHADTTMDAFMLANIDGLKIWVRELNRWNAGMVNANRPRVQVAYKGRGLVEASPIIDARQRPASQHALNKLAQMFAKH